MLAYLKERTGGTVPISLKMTWEEVSQTAYLLDQSYGSGAEAAYSTRQLRNAATDCMVIRRASDSTTTTIGFDGSGNIDESAITTFCTGTTCTVYQWLDQSGNGNDATAAAPANEPTIYTGGALVKESGKVALQTTGTEKLSTSTALTQPFSAFTTASVDIASLITYDALWGDYSGTNRGIQYRVVGRVGMYFGTVLQSSFYSMKSSREIYTAIVNGASSLIDVSGTNVASGNTGSGNINNTGLFGYSTYLAEGKYSEFLFFDSAKSSNDQDSIEENIGDYFTQNTPLLDTYSGAAAAYSLRLLDSSYVGSAVEVYNGSSYADIGFNVFGELDTVALAAHCGSNNGFVSKWYDQSGNTNTAAQTTTANMPKIYDGTTGVVTENGKAAVQFINSNRYALQLTSGVTPKTLILVTNPSTIQLQYTLNVYNSDESHRLLNGDWFLDQTGSNDWFNENNGDSYLNASQVTGRPSADFQHIYFGWNTSPATSPFTAFSNTANVGGTNRSFDGPVQEIIIYTNTDYTDSTNRTNIEDNINTFYNIY